MQSSQTAYWEWDVRGRPPEPPLTCWCPGSKLVPGLQTFSISALLTLKTQGVGYPAVGSICGVSNADFHSWNLFLFLPHTERGVVNLALAASGTGKAVHKFKEMVKLDR